MCDLPCNASWMGRRTQTHNLYVPEPCATAAGAAMHECHEHDDHSVLLQTGIRFQPARATTNQKDAVPGRPCPDALLEDEQAALQDMQRCIEQFHDDSRYGFCPRKTYASQCWVAALLLAA